MPVFIALHIGDERLQRIGELFKEYGYRVVDLENQHLTILFIGDYKGVFLKKIVVLLENISLLLPSVLRPTNLSLLPAEKNTNVVVLVKEDSRLSEARRIVMEYLEKNNIAIRDRYSFTPHITIARRRKPLSRSMLNKVVVMLRRAQKILPRFIVVRNAYLYETSREGYRRILELKTKWV